MGIATCQMTIGVAEQIGLPKKSTVEYYFNLLLANNHLPPDTKVTSVIPALSNGLKNIYVLQLSQPSFKDSQVFLVDTDKGNITLFQESRFVEDEGVLDVINKNNTQAETKKEINVKNFAGTLNRAAEEAVGRLAREKNEIVKQEVSKSLDYLEQWMNNIVEANGDIEKITKQVDNAFYHIGYIKGLMR